MTTTERTAPEDRHQILLDAGERMIVDTSDLDITSPDDEEK